MPLHVYRSQRVEELADELANELRRAWPDDPFEGVTVVVGNRAMARWIRHDLAIRVGGIARIDFASVREAFEGGAVSDAWTSARLVHHVLACTRARLGEPRFDRIRDYLGDVKADVRGRELSFAIDVCGALERMLYDRPDDALAWADGPRSAPVEHGWLADLLHDLHARIPEPSPARVFADKKAAPAGAEARPIFAFGLSALQPGDRLRLEVLARDRGVHLFVIAPSRKAAGGNALLAANAPPGAELARWLDANKHDERLEHRPPPSHYKLLARLQDWIDRAGDDPVDAPWSASASCDSIEIHACHGPLRQCEALRDALLRRFAKDETLEPRHVLVITPDVETYAPLLSAVLARGGRDVPRIPLHVADLGIRSTNPVADALLATLALADERVTAARLLDLLSLRPVRARFALGEDDLADLRSMVIESGMRWAWDADDRAAHGQPAIDQNTIRFGLERLALGVLMHDPGALGVVPSAGALGAAVPLDLVPRERVERFGRLAEACDAVRALSLGLTAPTTSGAWRERLDQVLDALTLVAEDTAWLRLQVDERLTELLPDQSDLLVDRSAIVALLRDAFEVPQHGDRPVTGGVTLCGFEPMRSVPFRVIAMLGLDDGEFPRKAAVAAWSPFARPAPGEIDRRATDRHVFLESILCARDALLVFATGFEPQRGAHAPLSVPVAELVEVLAAGIGVEPEALVIRHPLQPWSENAFSNERVMPFDSLWKAAAKKNRAPKEPVGLSATKTDCAWPPEDDPPRTITADALANALASPQKELLKHRLGLLLDRDDTDIPEREPLEHDGLGEWAIRDRVLSASQSGTAPDAEQLEERLRGEGVLALSACGRGTLVDCIEDAEKARENARKVPGTPGVALQVSATIDGLVVAAVATDVRVDGATRRLVWTTASKEASPRDRLRAWITMLVALAAGEPVGSAHVAACKRTIDLYAPETADVAREYLDRLVSTWRSVRRRPLLLFPHLSPALVDARIKKPTVDVEGLLLEKECFDAWEGSFQRAGDRADRWVAPLFGHLAIEDLRPHAVSLLETASAVWAPLAASKPAASASKPKRKKS